jgi:hypothetical protein
LASRHVDFEDLESSPPTSVLAIFAVSNQFAIKDSVLSTPVTMAANALQQRDHLDSLPTELKCAVADHLPMLNDLKALSLVNKAWAEVVLPIMWKCLVTDLTPSGRQDISDLAHLRSNIAQHVRTLVLKGSRGNRPFTNLPLLLVAIHRDQLRELTSDIGIPAPTLVVALQLQTGIKMLKLPGTQALSVALQSPHTSGSLDSVANLVLIIGSLTHEGYQTVWNRCPNLIRLQLSQSQSIPSAERRALHGNDFLPPPGPDALSNKETSSYTKKHRVLKLQELVVIRMQLPSMFDDMFRRIDILVLQKLRLAGALGAAGFLKALAKAFAEGKPALQSLRIVRHDAQGNDEFTQNLGLLLESFQGLRQLHVNCYGCDKIAVKSIRNHGKTLTDLAIFNGNMFRMEKAKCTGAADIKGIASTCPKIEQLCLNLYELDPDEPEGEVLGPPPNISFQPTAFESALSAITSMETFEYCV